MDDLLKLKVALETARAAYQAHQMPDNLSLEQRVQFDIEEKKLLRAASDANIAYGKALDLIIKQENLIIKEEVV